MLDKALQIIRETIAKPKEHDDSVLLPLTDNNDRETFVESDAATFADTINAVFSQFRQIMFGTLASKRWTDIPPITMQDLAAQGSPVVNEVPIGDKNCVNIEFATANEFVPGTLELWYQGIKMTPADDYIENSANYQSFTLVIDSLNPNKLNSAPKPHQSLLVNYRAKII